MSESYTLTGEVIAVQPEQTFASGFTKQAVIISDCADKYPQEIAFEAVKEKIALLAGLNAGDKVTVAFNVRGREYDGKWFVNLQLWKLDVIAAAAPVADNPLDEEIPMDEEEPPPF
jgi:hypothetical protein